MRNCCKTALWLVIGFGVWTTQLWVFGQTDLTHNESAQRIGNSGIKLAQFEVATIRPARMDPGTPIGLFTYPGGEVIARNYTLRLLMMEAFRVQSFQIEGGPSWVNNNRYDIVAKPPESSDSTKLNSANMNTPLSDEQRQMLRALLIDRFQLKFHNGTKYGRVYILSRGKKPLKLQEPTQQNREDWNMGVAGDALTGGAPIGTGLIGKNISMSTFAARLSLWLGRPVIDQTAIKGSYDFKNIYAPQPAPDEVIPSIFGSIKAIGLELKAGKGSVETIVIDRVEKPTSN
jgi:uncharacterized protein (TIGR03435 family)